MTTLEDRRVEVPARPSEKTLLPQVHGAAWLDALKFHAASRTADDLRAQAAMPGWVAGLAYVDGVTPEQERRAILVLADCVDALAAAGLTPRQAFGLANLRKDFGSFEDFAALAVA